MCEDWHFLLHHSTANRNVREALQLLQGENGDCETINSRKTKNARGYDAGVLEGRLEKVVQILLFILFHDEEGRRTALSITIIFSLLPATNYQEE